MDRAALLCVRGPAGNGQDPERDERGAQAAGAHEIVRGVPTGISRSSPRMSALRMRMHPWETRPGSRSGRSVPWMPTYPPAGQSVSVGDRALVPKATGP